jgi:cyanophycinase-like exopeptidase
MAAVPRLLVLMGSGETSPTMVATHRELFARLGEDAGAVLLETPYAFQENAAEISAKAQAYFGRSVGRRVEVLRHMAAGAEPLAAETALARLRAARWAFAGPGSPSYALDAWRSTQVPSALADLVQRGGCAVFASAAACTVGTRTLPVYEVYKVGQEPRWLEGLDLVGVAELPVAIVPHYDNAEGGTHDTRFCYMGERRLLTLEAQLPGDTAILGVDEHTAVVLDLDLQAVVVTGRGGLTVRRRGREWTWPSGETVSLDELRRVVAGRSGRAAASQATGSETGARAPAAREVGPVLLLPQVVDGCAEAFQRAHASRDAAGMVEAILELDRVIVSWSADTLESDDLGRAHSILRSLVVTLGEAASAGLRDPAEALAPIVESLISVRAALRADGHYDLADAVRGALAAADIELRDQPDTTVWQLRNGHHERQP